MADVPFLTYPLVFLMVFVPYLVVAAVVDTPKPQSDAGRKSLPPVYRIFYRYIVALSQTVGSSLANAAPRAARRYRDVILMSGFNITAEIIFAAQAFTAGMAAFLACVAVFLLSGDPSGAVMAAALAGFLGWVYPSMAVARHARRRQSEIIKTLPFSIDLITSAMSAGLDFAAAVRYYVGMGGRNALAVEFGLLLRQMELGKSRVEALLEMGTHVQTEEFSAFVGAVAHGTEIGASIIDTLRIQGEDMRRARFNVAERKAARAPTLMIFPIVLFIVPSVFIIVMTPVILQFMSARGG